MEFGTMFVTTTGDQAGVTWKQDRSVLGTRLIGFGASQASALLACVTDGTRLASPGASGGSRDLPRLDRDCVRWNAPGSVRCCTTLGCANLCYARDAIFALSVCFQAIAGPEKDVAAEFGAMKVKYPACLRPCESDGSAMQVAIGTEHCAMLTRDGSVFTWGVGSQGQLGIGKLATYVQFVVLV
jgi:hypothetical protein